jgi:hypothetical protein
MALAVVSLAALSSAPALASPAVRTGSGALGHPQAAGAVPAVSPAGQPPTAGVMAPAVPAPPIKDLPKAAMPLSAPRPAASPAAGVGSSFSGMSQGAKGIPSDSGAAGGPRNVLEQVNGAVAVFTRAGALEFGPVASSRYYGVPARDVQSDPHTIYDPYGNRFIAIMQDRNKNAWMVSVTTGSDAAESSRCIYTISAHVSGATVDFPLVAVGPKYLMLTVREIGGGNANRLTVINRAALETCKAVTTWNWTNVANPGGGAADTLVPVLDYNKADTFSYLLNSMGGGGNRVSLYKFSNSGSKPGNLISASVSVPSYTVAAGAAQKGSAVKIAVGNCVITQAVNYAHGMYATLTTGFGAGVSAIHWMEFNPNAQRLIASGTISNPKLSFFYSSVSEGSNGTTFITYELSGRTIFPSAAGIIMSINHSILVNRYIRQGAHPTPESRWGDFSTTYTDPANTNYFWTASQVMADASHYGTVIGHYSL